jgi:hypothetical protein
MINRTKIHSYFFWTASLSIVGLLLLAAGPHLLAASDDDDSLTTQEVESLNKAKDPEQKLKSISNCFSPHESSNSPVNKIRKTLPRP